METRANYEVEELENLSTTAKLVAHRTNVRTWNLIEFKGKLVKAVSSDNITKVFNVDWLLDRIERGDAIELEDGSLQFSGRAMTTEEFDAL